MNSKPDNKCGNSENITLLFEMIMNSRYGKVCLTEHDISNYYNVALLRKSLTATNMTW